MKLSNWFEARFMWLKKLKHWISFCDGCGYSGWAEIVSNVPRCPVCGRRQP
jgi:hypothetical protein